MRRAPPSSGGRYQEVPGIVKRNPALVKKMVEVGREQKAIFAIPMFIAFAQHPQFDMAGDQVAVVGNTRDPTTDFLCPASQVLRETPLADPRAGDSFTVFGGQRSVLFIPLLRQTAGSARTIILVPP